MKQIILFVILLSSTLSFSQVINIPADYISIQAGIDAASDGDTVLVENGTYYENINFMGKAITVASFYLMDADTGHISNTIIDGSQPSHADTGSVVLFISGEDTTSVLSGFTITNGTGTIADYTFENNVTPARLGGGIFCYNSGARISYNKITNNQISDDSVSIGGGSGIAAYPMSTTAHVIIEDNQIVSNTVTCAGTLPCGVFLVGNGTIKNNDISFNKSNATYNAIGGGVGCWSSVPRTVMIKNNTITHNLANGNNAYSGGLVIQADMNASVISNEISYNEVNAIDDGGGGGISVYYITGRTIIDRNIISNNLTNGNTMSGGGINLFGNYNGNLLITNNIISSNSALRGGGINCEQSIATIANNTIVNNTADKGGGISTSVNKPIIFNTLFWNNQASVGPQIYGTPIVAYSNIQDSLWEGENNISAEPFFADTLFHLSDSSLCVGNGTESILGADVTYDAPSVDFGGNERPNPVDVYVDIGAYESEYSRVPTSVDWLNESIPKKFNLSQNYPNPFNPSTNIKYSIPFHGYVTLKVFDVLGREVSVLINQKQTQGNYEVEFGASELTSGIYFYRIQAGEFVDTKKMILIK